ncbi:MAG: hypothetical protein AAFO93_16160, partial [Pseudomonadota bacterium]
MLFFFRAVFFFLTPDFRDSPSFEKLFAETREMRFLAASSPDFASFFFGRYFFDFKWYLGSSSIMFEISLF